MSNAFEITRRTKSVFRGSEEITERIRQEEAEQRFEAWLTGQKEEKTWHILDDELTQTENEVNKQMCDYQGLLRHRENKRSRRTAPQVKWEHFVIGILLFMFATWVSGDILRGNITDYPKTFQKQLKDAQQHFKPNSGKTHSVYTVSSLRRHQICRLFISV